MSPGQNLERSGWGVILLPVEVECWCHIRKHRRQGNHPMVLPQTSAASSEPPCDPYSLTSGSYWHSSWLSPGSCLVDDLLPSPSSSVLVLLSVRPTFSSLKRCLPGCHCFGESGSHQTRGSQTSDTLRWRNFPRRQTWVGFHVCVCVYFCEQNIPVRCICPEAGYFIGSWLTGFISKDKWKYHLYNVGWRICMKQVLEASSNSDLDYN